MSAVTPKEGCRGSPAGSILGADGFKLGASATLDGEEACLLFLAWEEIGATIGLRTKGRGGVPGATALEQEAAVVLDVQEWWFLKI